MGLETALQASFGMQVAGTAMNFVATRNEGKAEKKAYDYNAKVLRGEAESEIQTGLDEQRLIRERAKRITAAQIAIAAAGGGTPTGSTLAVMADSAVEAEMDAQRAIRNRELRAQSLLTEASLQTFYGKQAKRAANIRAISSLIGNAGSMLLQYAPYLQKSGRGGSAAATGSGAYGGTMGGGPTGGGSRSMIW